MHPLSLLMFTVLLQAADYGPAVGAKAPDVEAPDQNGKVQSLRSILGPNGAMLVFFRSADW